MGKVSKNLKKIRKEKGITQEELAGKLNVTRQAISNWENDKSQPDIESLKLIADVFSTDIEELLYGEKRNVGTTADKTKEKNRIKIILSIIGSLFIGIGVVLVFFNFWNDFSMPIQTTFSLLPLLASQAFALFVFLKKRDKLQWQESSGIILTVGVISTIALINAVFDMYCGYELCILIDTLMCIPILFVLNSVSPLAICYFLAINWTFLSKNIIAGAVLFILISLYIFYLYKRNDLRQKYAMWVGTLSLVAFTAVSSICIFDNEISNIFVAVIAVCLVLYLLSHNNCDLSSPFKVIGIIGFSATALFYSYFYISEFSYSWKISSAFTKDEIITKFILLLIATVFIAMAAFIKRKDFVENIYKALISISSFLFITSDLIFSLTKVKAIVLIAPIFIMINGILIIIKGVNDLKLLYINFGLTVAFIQLMEYLSLFSLNLILFGFAFVLFGVGLITINAVISKKKRSNTLVAASEVTEK